MRRREESSPFTLFSFQDIIMCVTGIVILLTLLLVLDLVTEATSAASNPVLRRIEELRRQIQRLRSRERQLREELRKEPGPAALKARTAILLREQQHLESELAELRQQETARAPEVEETRRQVQSLQDTVDELTQDILALEKKLSDWKGKPLTKFRTAGRFQYRPWLADVSGKGVAVTRLDDPDVSYSFASHVEFLRWLDQTCDPASDYILVVLRPSGLRAFDPISERLRSRKYPHGYDLLAEHEALVVAPGGTP